MNNTNNTTAGIDLDKLEAHARGQRGGMFLSTDEVIALIQLARRSTTANDAVARALDWYDREQAENEYGITRDSFHLFILELIDASAASGSDGTAVAVVPDRDIVLEAAVQAIAARAGESDRIDVVSAFDAIRSLKTNRHALPIAAATSGSELAPDERWTCFHCGESFTDHGSAALHFGRTERQEPICGVGQERYREMELRMEAYNAEDADIHRQMHAMQTKHQQALQRAEEDGYAKGLRDAARFPSDAAAYAYPALAYAYHKWPWAAHFWKPADDRRNLVKAGALILAAIKRLDRAARRECLQQLAAEGPGTGSALVDAVQPTAPDAIEAAMADAIVHGAGAFRVHGDGSTERVDLTAEEHRHYAELAAFPPNLQRDALYHEYAVPGIKMAVAAAMPKPEGDQK